jgi:acetyltransferase-like isoleucine patch superfamily enzyme
MKLRTVIAVLISVLPTSGIRVFAYRTLFKYEIVESTIGFGTVLAVDSAKIIRSSIGKFNVFTGPMTVSIKERARIGMLNSFSCGLWTLQQHPAGPDYARSVEIGKNTLITSHHFFDIAGAFVLGNNSWIAGRGSQFWTHGANASDRNISIGMDCYLGSAVRFAPGASIGNNALVGLGSVVTKKFDLDNALIAGTPAVIVKQNYHWKTREHVG